MQKKLLPITILITTVGFLFAVNSAKAQNFSKTKKAGNVTVTLKVLPAEQFKGPNAAMKWDAGASPDYIEGSSKPNHHLVAFVKKNGKPVEKASVTIHYRELSPKKSGWMTLPVARMHVSGKSLATTHYGNNVWLAMGKYEASVKVNDNPPATFHFTLTK